jgi:hypothetical protein
MGTTPAGCYEGAYPSAGDLNLTGLVVSSNALRIGVLPERLRGKSLPMFRVRLTLSTVYIVFIRNAYLYCHSMAMRGCSTLDHRQQKGTLAGGNSEMNWPKVVTGASGGGSALGTIPGRDSRRGGRIRVRLRAGAVGCKSGLPAPGSRIIRPGIDFPHLPYKQWNACGQTLTFMCRPADPLMPARPADHVGRRRVFARAEGADSGPAA